MSQLTRAQIADAARAGGFPESAIPVAVAVALAESGGRTDAVSPTGDYGLFQINKNAHGDLFGKYDWKDANQNAKMAYSVYSASGNWNPWSVYKSGSYRKFYSPTAPAAGPKVTVSGVDIPTSQPNVTVSGVDISGTQTTTGAQGMVNNPLSALGFVGTTAFWQRFGIGAIGAFLIIVGIVIVFRKPIMNGVSTATSIGTKGLVNIPKGTS